MIERGTIHECYLGTAWGRGCNMRIGENYPELFGKEFFLIYLFKRRLLIILYFNNDSYNENSRTDFR